MAGLVLAISFLGPGSICPYGPYARWLTATLKWIGATPGFPVGARITSRAERHREIVRTVSQKIGDRKP